MVRNFNELVLQQARKEDRVDRLAKEKAKEILDKKRERDVGLHRTGELFRPITTRLDIAHKYRKEMDDPETDRNKAKKAEKDAMNKLITDALADKFTKEDVKELVLRMGEHGWEEKKDFVKEIAKALKIDLGEDFGEMMEEEDKKDKATGGVDTPFPEEMKLTPPGSPGIVPPSQQPTTSTPAPSQFDLGSLLQTPQTQPSSGSPSPPNPFVGPPDQEAEEDEDGTNEGLEGYEGGVESSGEESSSTTKGSDDGNATISEESEGYDTEKIGAKLKVWKERKTFKDLKERLNRSDVQDRVKIGSYPYITGPYAFLTYDQLKKVVDSPEKKRGDMSTFKFLKKMGHKPYGSEDTFYGWNEKGKKKKMEEFEKKKEKEKKQMKAKKGSKPSNTGSGLDDSLTESQRLKAFAIVKRNIGSANAGNTSKQSVQQTIDAIQLLFLSQEITNQQRMSLLQKLKSAINK